MSRTTSLAARLELGCWIAAAMAIVGAGLGWRAGTPAGEAPSHAASSRAAPAYPSAFGVASRDTIAIVARIVVESDPFRFDRHPPVVSYRPELEGVVAPPKPAKAGLALLGLVGSPRTRWAALLDGIPGRVGPALVHAGDTLAGLHVQRIGRDTAVVTGADTTWRLTVRRLWQ